MTGLERQVHNFFSSQRVPGRYLTLFYVITVSLALILALLAIYLYKEKPGTVSVSSTPVVIPQSIVPTRAGTQEQTYNTPTPMPVIPSTPNIKTPSTLGVTAAELNGVVVRLWHPWTGENGSLLQSILDGFNRANQWGITVEAGAYEGFGRLDEAVESALLTNTQPDMIIDYGFQAMHWDGSNSLLDLIPYVNDPVWGLSGDEQADYFPGFWAEDVFLDRVSGDSRRLGIPYYRSAYVMFYNQSWAHEMGYPNPPVTPEDFRVRACAAAQDVSSQGDKSDLGKGGWLITAQPGVLAGWLYAFGGDIADPDGGGYRLNTPESLKALEYLKGLQASGCAWYDPEADAASEFANRRALFIVGSLVDVPAQQSAFNQEEVQDEWLILPFPSSTEVVVDSYGPSIMITPSTRARQLAAWLVVQWLTYPPNQAEWAEMLGTYPTRKSSLDYLTDQTDTHPQRSQALAILPMARSEPSLASWRVVRWMFTDVMGQLFDPQFAFDQIPALLEYMQSMATEIFVLVR